MVDKNDKRLKIKAWKSSIPLPSNPSPNSIFYIKEGSNFSIKAVDSSGRYLEHIVKEEGLGYALLINTLHTETNPFLFERDTPFAFPLRNDTSVSTQSSFSIDNLIDNTTNEIVASNLNDMFIMRLEFKLKTSLSDRKGIFMFNIGTEDKFNTKSFTGSDQANQHKIVSEEIMFFQGNDFQKNKGIIETTVNGFGEIYDIQLLVKKLHNGKNI